MKVSNIIVYPEPDQNEDCVIEWRLVKINGHVTLQARNPGGEFTGVALISRGMLDHTFTPSVRGIKTDLEGFIMLARDREKQDLTPDFWSDNA